MQTFRSLRHRNYRLYFFGQMISLVGSWMQSTVLIWLAYELTHEFKWPAFLMVAQIGPTFLLGAWAGGLADRFPKRRLIVLTQIAFLLSASLMTIFIFCNWITIEWMVTLMCLHGIIQAVDLPARLAFVPDLVERDDLINAVSLNSLLFNVARLVGPAIAGVLLEYVGAGLCILINALSYIAVLGALMAMNHLPQQIKNREVRNDYENGFQALRKQPRMLLLALMAGFLAICGWPLLTLLPGFSDRILQSGPQGYSTLLSSLGAGALLAALTGATFGSEDRRRGFLLGGIAFVCIGLLILSQMKDLFSASIACGLFGYGMILFFATGQAAIQLSATDENRGKVMGVWAMMLSGGVPVGNLVIGPLADRFPVTTVILGQGIVVTIVLSILLLGGVGSNRDVKSMAN
jgi:MFS family permease